VRRSPVADEGFARRSRRFLWIGAIAGAVVGGVIGAIVGAVAFEGGRGMWASILAGAVFVGGVGAFVAGVSSLGPPRPGRELAAEDPDPAARTSGGRGDASPEGDLVVRERGLAPEAPEAPGAPEATADASDGSVTEPEERGTSGHRDETAP
jgi:hypothetical protein